MRSKGKRICLKKSLTLRSYVLKNNPTNQNTPTLMPLAGTRPPDWYATSRHHSHLSTHPHPDSLVTQPKNIFTFSYTKTSVFSFFQLCAGGGGGNGQRSTVQKERTPSQISLKKCRWPLTVEVCSFFDFGNHHFHDFSTCFGHSLLHWSEDANLWSLFRWKLPVWQIHRSAEYGDFWILRNMGIPNARALKAVIEASGRPEVRKKVRYRRAGLKCGVRGNGYV